MPVAIRLFICCKNWQQRMQMQKLQKVHKKHAQTHEKALSGTASMEAVHTGCCEDAFLHFTTQIILATAAVH